MMTEDERMAAVRALVSQAKAMLAGAEAIVANGHWPDQWSQDRAKEYLRCAVGDCEAVAVPVPR